MTHSFIKLPLAAAIAGLCLSLAQLPAQAQTAAATVADSTEYSRWTRAINTLTAGGYERIEEIELTMLGRFEVDALNAQRVEHDLSLDKDGSRILNSGTDGSIDDGADTVSAERLHASLAWLQQQGCHGLRQLSVDDGRIEAEAKNAQGKRVEIALNPETMDIVKLEVERFLDFD